MMFPVLHHSSGGKSGFCGGHGCPTTILLRGVNQIVVGQLGAGERGNLGLQQVLEPTAHDLRDQGVSSGALHELAQLGGATMGEGHGLCSVWW